METRRAEGEREGERTERRVCFYECLMVRGKRVCMWKGAQAVFQGFSGRRKVRGIYIFFWRGVLISDDYLKA